MQIEQTNEWMNERMSLLSVWVYLCVCCGERMSMYVLCSPFAYSTLYLMYTHTSNGCIQKLYACMCTEFIQFLVLYRRMSVFFLFLYPSTTWMCLHHSFSVSMRSHWIYWVQKELCENGKSFIRFDCNNILRAKCKQTNLLGFYFDLN